MEQKKQKNKTIGNIVGVFVSISLLLLIAYHFTVPVHYELVCQKTIKNKTFKFYSDSTGELVKAYSVGSFNWHSWHDTFFRKNMSTIVSRIKVDLERVERLKCNN